MKTRTGLMILPLMMSGEKGEEMFARKTGVPTLAYVTEYSHTELEDWSIYVNYIYRLYIDIAIATPPKQAYPHTLAGLVMLYLQGQM